jgi:catechol-2,3-dioxygenase
MSRVQLAVNVSDLESSITFYSALLSTEPSKVRPGYANFAVDDPPLKLVLIEKADGRGSGVAGSLNHLGIEVESAEEVAHAAGRLSGRGMPTDLHENTTCCHALQDKVWVDDPDHVPWEIYTVLADVDAADDGNAPVLFGEGSAARAPSESSTTHCC